MLDTAIFASCESEVRSYCRDFPVVFEKAKGSVLWDTSGRRYLDFFAGAGSLNYGHNNDTIKQALLEHLASDTIVQSLDLHTAPKARFLEALRDHVLRPRGFEGYRVQFPGPTGTNAVEAALKLARKVTGRADVIAFTNGFHGVSLGALAATATRTMRSAAGLPLTSVTRAAYDGYFGPSVDTVAMTRRLLEDPSSGVPAPAAFIVETVQGEGGLNVATDGWLRALATLARDVGALLIVDDIQAGCGRTGSFFSFEPAGLRPDIVCLSKSIGGYGLPLSVVLIASDRDAWAPGEHNGTFRGSNLSFTAATAAIEAYWRDDTFANELHDKAIIGRARLNEIASVTRGTRVVGRGLMLGLRFTESGHARAVARRCFECGLIAETCGPDSNTVKLLPPLTIAPEDLIGGLEILASCVRDTTQARHAVHAA